MKSMVLLSIALCDFYLIINVILTTHVNLSPFKKKKKTKKNTYLFLWLHQALVGACRIFFSAVACSIFLYGSDGKESS